MTLEGGTVNNFGNYIHSPCVLSSSTPALHVQRSRLCSYDPDALQTSITNLYVAFGKTTV